MNIQTIVIQVVVTCQCFSLFVFERVKGMYIFGFACMHFNIFVVFVCVSLFCRGFGFVTFTDAASVDKVLAQQHHELDSKTVS